MGGSRVAGVSAGLCEPFRRGQPRLGSSFGTFDVVGRSCVVLYRLSTLLLFLAVI